MTATGVSVEWALAILASVLDDCQANPKMRTEIKALIKRLNKTPPGVKLVVALGNAPSALLLMRTCLALFQPLNAIDKLYLVAVRAELDGGVAAVNDGVGLCGGGVGGAAAAAADALGPR